MDWQIVDGKTRWVPVDDLMDKGIPISDTLEIVWNKTRTDLSINSVDGKQEQCDANAYFGTDFCFEHWFH